MRYISKPIFLNAGVCPTLTFADLQRMAEEPFRVVDLYQRATRARSATN